MRGRCKIGHAIEQPSRDKLDALPADAETRTYLDTATQAAGWGASIGEQEAQGHAVDAVLVKPYRLDDVRNAIGRLTA